MSTECWIQFNEAGEPDRIIPQDMIIAQPRVELCVLYTHEEDFVINRVQNNNQAIARFAGKLIGDLGFRIPHPEFYPDDYAKFEKDWKKFTKHAKDHQKIIELLKREAEALAQYADGLKGENIDTTDCILRFENTRDELKKLGVYPNEQT